MGEKVYITKFDEITKRVKGLEIINIERVEIPCNLDDIVLTFSDGSKLSITDEFVLVHSDETEHDNYRG